MVTDDDWIRFIQAFFNLHTNPKWLKHVVANWNHLNNEPGCKCRFHTPFPTYCDDYLDMTNNQVNVDD